MFVLQVGKVVNDLERDFIHVVRCTCNIVY
jgi:hypothetical protein